MTATVTRTLQAPQYAPINMTLTEECTPDTFTATLNKLADLIENTLRERYPQYAGVLPIVQKEAVNNHPPFQDEIKVKGSPLFQPADKVIQVNRGDNSKRAEFYLGEINACTTVNQLEEYKAIAQTYGLMKEWEIKSIFLRTDAQINSRPLQNQKVAV
jgi:hypothetical protein